MQVKVTQKQLENDKYRSGQSDTKTCRKWGRLLSRRTSAYVIRSSCWISSSIVSWLQGAALVISALSSLSFIRPYHSFFLLYLLRDFLGFCSRVFSRGLRTIETNYLLRENTNWRRNYLFFNTNIERRFAGKNAHTRYYREVGVFARKFQYYIWLLYAKITRKKQEICKQAFQRVSDAFDLLWGRLYFSEHGDYYYYCVILHATTYYNTVCWTVLLGSPDARNPLSGPWLSRLWGAAGTMQHAWCLIPSCWRWECAEMTLQFQNVAPN